MSITAAQILRRALLLSGSVDAEQDITVQEYTDALYACNSMLDSWRLDSLLVYELVEHTKVLTPGTGVYTIGTGGAINVERPDQIEQAWTIIDDIRYWVEIVQETMFKRHPDPTTASDVVRELYYDRAFPLGSINLWPVPSVASELHILAWKELTSFASTATQLVFPPGYQLAIETNLAVILAPENGLEANADVKAEARRSKGAIRKLNSRIEPLQQEIGRIGSYGRGRWDWRIGESR